MDVQGLTQIRGLHESAESLFSGLGGEVRKIDAKGGWRLLGWLWENYGKKLLELGEN